MTVSPSVKTQWFERPLTMSLRDIIKEYREAKFPKKQIDILADLNHTKPCRIAWLLDRCGEVVDKTKLPRKPRNADAPDLDMIWRDTPLGAEAAQLNTERKHRIMEEKAMRMETDAVCPVKAEEIPDVFAENTPECELSAEGTVENPKEIDEMTLFREGLVGVPSRTFTKPAEVPDKACPARQSNLAELITAEFWQIYLSHTLRPVNERDVAAMLTLANIAERLVE